MPLIHQTHRPPELLQEIRALWRRVDRLDTNAIAAGGVGTQGPPGPPGVAVAGTVFSWLQKIEFRSNVTGPQSRSLEFTVVPSIEGAYTHLEVHLAILRNTFLSTSVFTVRGNQPFKDPFPSGGEGEHDILDPPIHYDAVPISGAFTGLFLLGPTGYGGSGGDNPRIGTAYYPIRPENKLDALVLKWDFEWFDGASVFCFAAFAMGRYVVHPSTVFSTDPCSSG